jgi:hypothetical protein
MARKPKEDETPEADGRIEAMNALAVRMFEGQSDHVPMIQRVARIKSNLSAKGYEDLLDSIVLPHPDYKRYL